MSTIDTLKLLQAELDATNRQVEILSDALAESRREVAALKAVQSAERGEPVAWMSREDYDDYLEESKVTSATVYNYQLDIPLYTTPPGGRQSENCLTAAQRQSARSAWVGLTDEEVMNATRKEGHELLDFIYEYGTGSEGTEERVVAICKAIEAKLKEKNNG